MDRVLRRASVLSFIVLMTTGCMQKMVAPQSPQSSMAIIEPIISGKMRVGLSWNSYSYHEKPSTIILMNNQNRLACADLRNTGTGATFPPHYFSGATLCYYPNITAGQYVLMDYPMKQPHEAYRVFLITLYNTLLFDDKKITFSIGSGDVKHVGKYVINMKDTGSKLKVQSISRLDATPSIARARQELAFAKTPWRLK